LLHLPVQPCIVQQGTVQIYYFPQQQDVHFKCNSKGDWDTFSLKLFGGGVLNNVSSCYITTEKLQFYRELQGELDSAIPSPTLYVPEVSPVLSTQELHTLQQLVPVNTEEVDQMATRISNHYHGKDVNSLMQLQAVSLKHEERTKWLLYALIVVSTILGTFLCYYCTLPFLGRIVKKWKQVPNVPVHSQVETECPFLPPHMCNLVLELKQSAVTPIRFSTYCPQNE
jgi:hypothetical protein